jgi:hypothetical protein
LGYPFFYTMIEPLVFTKIELNMLKRMLNFKLFKESDYFLNGKTILNIKSTKLSKISETKFVVNEGWLFGRFITGEVIFGDEKFNLKQIVDLNHRSQYLGRLIREYDLVETAEVKILDDKGRVSKKGVQVYRIRQDKSTFVKIWLYFLNYSDYIDYSRFLSSDYINNCKPIFEGIIRNFDKIVPNKDKLKSHFLSVYLKNPKEFSNSYKSHMKKRIKLKNKIGGKTKKQ